MHLLGVLHRDVKPANILIDAYNNAGLADFGLAALIDPDNAAREALWRPSPRRMRRRRFSPEAGHRVRRRLFPGGRYMRYSAVMLPAGRRPWRCRASPK